MAVNSWSESGYRFGMRSSPAVPLWKSGLAGLSPTESSGETASVGYPLFGGRLFVILSLAYPDLGHAPEGRAGVVAVVGFGRPQLAVEGLAIAVSRQAIWRTSKL